MLLRSLCHLAPFAVQLALAAPAMAQMNIDGVNSCLSERLAAGQTPATCVDEAHSACTAVNSDRPAVATLCFVEVEKDWQSGIAALMTTIKEKANEDIAAVAGVEGKYDLLSALLQCSRMEELAVIVGRESDDAIQRQTARCKANAAGLTYARLFLRSRNL
ncbi:hypothetical protein [Hoeflea sp.]|uniref:hypothetical protein n=1 Tax=Hoeflea sp. TaxID=1940281 RepID=UPI00374890AF